MCVLIHKLYHRNLLPRIDPDRIPPHCCFITVYFAGVLRVNQNSDAGDAQRRSDEISAPSNNARRSLLLNAPVCAKLQRRLFALRQHLFSSGQIMC